MKHLRKLTRKEKIRTEKEGFKSSDFLRLTRNENNFVIVNINNNKEMYLIDYM